MTPHTLSKVSETEIMKDEPKLESLERKPAPVRGGRRTLSAVLLPVAVVVGLLLLVLLVFGERLRPRIPVRTATALLLDAPDGAPAATGRPGVGASIAMASGWIEPDPFPIQVAAKTAGYVENVLVLEGESVTNGQLIALLDPADLELSVQASRAKAKEAERAADVARAQLTSALVTITQAVSRVRVAQAAADVAADALERIRRLEAEDRSPVELISAERESESRSAELDVARLQVRKAEAERERHQHELARYLHQADELNAEADLVALQLSRARVFSGANGIVLKRHVQPGAKVGMDEVGTTIVTLYDPSALQVRVDVPLSDIAHVRLGQAARISTSAFPGAVFAGKVTRIVGSADITRNTLQVKVALVQPHARMRPEMLCRVEFLGATEAGAVTATQGGRGVWVQKAALTDHDGSSAVVWVMDPVSDSVSSREVTLAPNERDGLVNVAEGLRAGERVVIAKHGALREGALVKEEEHQP